MNFYATLQVKCVGLGQFPPEGQQWNCNQCFKCCIVILHKGAITEMILIYDLNARDFLHGDAKSSRNFASNSLGNFAWGTIFSREFAWGAEFSSEFCMGCRILCSVGDTKNTEGIPKFLGNLTRGGPGSPMTPEAPELGTPRYNG